MVPRGRMGVAGVAARRIISFDLDGVLASPPFGWNPTLDRNISLQPISEPAPLSAARRRGPLDPILTRTWYPLRYAGRAARPGALEAVRAAAERHDVIVLTGRSERGRHQTQAWLEANGFAPFVEELVMNDGSRPSARHKERQLAERDAALHADDDAATCALLARCGVPVALLDWPRNRGLDFPDGVRRYHDMTALAAELAALNAAAAEA